MPCGDEMVQCDSDRQSLTLVYLPLTLLPLKSIYWAGGDSSGSKVLAMQTKGPEFDSQNP